MSYLNADCPRIECYVRDEFLYDVDGREGVTGATIFGVSSVAGRALGFHALLNNGAMIWRLPIHALCTKGDAPRMKLKELELWDAFSYRLAVTEFSYLLVRDDQGLPQGPAGQHWQLLFPGIYRFTVDWFGNPDSEDPGPGGHKCAHVIELDNGCFTAQPNNRLCWAEPSKVRLFVDGKKTPDYKTNTHLWKCEDGSWQTSDDDRVFYDVERRT